MIILQKGKTLFGHMVVGVAVAIMSLLTVVGVQWFSDSVATLFFTPGTIQQNSFAGSLHASLPPDAQLIGTADAAPILENSQLPAPSPKQIPAAAAQTQKPAEIQARAYVLVAMPSGEVLFEKNIQKALPVASLTKLMTALVVLERYNLEQQITINAAAMAQEGEQGMVKLGETFSVKNLLYMMLMESSNRAAYALSDAMGNANFVALMNEDAVALGLAHTHFADSTGLSEKSYSSAKDIAILTYYLFDHYPLFREIVGTKEFGISAADGTLHHVAVNTNIFLGSDGVIGGKTGYTEAAQGCFVVIRQQENGQYGVYVVLGAADRAKEMSQLLNK